MTQTTTSTPRDRLVTSRSTGGVTVHLRPDGITKLARDANAGNVARLQRLLPRVAKEQRAEILELLTDEARTKLEAPAPRREGRPDGPASQGSPVAILRSHDQLTQAELAERLGKGDGAVRNAERRGFNVTLTTLAEYAEGAGASVDVVITHADGTQTRIPVPADQTA